MTQSERPDSDSRGEQLKRLCSSLWSEPDPTNGRIIANIAEQKQPNHKRGCKSSRPRKCQLFSTLPGRNLAEKALAVRMGKGCTTKKMQRAKRPLARRCMV